VIPRNARTFLDQVFELKLNGFIVGIRVAIVPYQKIYSSWRNAMSDLLSHELRQSVLRDIISLIEEKYVFPDKGKEIAIDARPSDSLAISLRTNAPVFVAEEVMKRSAQVDFKLEPEDKSEEGMKWLKILEDMDDEDFGNT
jgi:bifunctional DNase/RNase